MARKRFNFWLEDKRPDDWQVNELITTLKRAGQFTRAIREGLRLWVDLRAGNMDVLVELFPFIGDKITPHKPAPMVSGGGQSELAREIAAQIILQGGTPGLLMGAGQGPKPLKVPKFDLPSSFEEGDEPTVLIRASTNTDSSMNFVTALKSMQ